MTLDDRNTTEATLKQAQVRYAPVKKIGCTANGTKESPLLEWTEKLRYYRPEFAPEGTFVLTEKFYKQMSDLEYSLKFLRATARNHILCDTGKVRVALATVGEVCPGVNVVLRSLVKCLESEYKVKDVFAVRWGVKGLMNYGGHWSKIKSTDLEGVQNQGGSILGTCWY